jgi:hypothetical protein
MLFSATLPVHNSIKILERAPFSFIFQSFGQTIPPIYNGPKNVKGEQVRL